MSDDPQAQRMAAAHTRCWNLLPWLVNGTLSPVEASAAEQHIAECKECATEIELQRGLQAQLRDGDSVLMAPQSAWQKMAERLDHEDEALAQGHFTLRKKNVGPWQWAVAAQALLIVGLVTWLQVRSPNSQVNPSVEMLQPRYETLTATIATTDTTTRGSVRVVFRRDVTLAEVSTLLRALPAQIVAGPSEAGVYSLALPVVTAPDSGDHAADVLKRLRTDARVIFAEPESR